MSPLGAAYPPSVMSVAKVKRAVVIEMSFVRATIEKIVNEACTIDDKNNNNDFPRRSQVSSQWNEGLHLICLNLISEELLMSQSQSLILALSVSAWKVLC